MTRPPLGLCVPVEYVRCRDADTVVVKLRTSQQVAVRLIDCWAAEAGTREGDRASDYCERLLADAREQNLPMVAWFPLACDRDKSGVIDLTDMLKALSFDRVPGRLFVGDRDLSVILVAEALATKERT